MHLIEEVLSDVFCRWIDFGKRGKIVDEAVIEIVDHLVHKALNMDEIDQQSVGIQFFSLYGNPYPVIMAMNVFALAVVITQGVPGRERLLHRNLKHERTFRPLLYWC